MYKAWHDTIPCNEKVNELSDWAFRLWAMGLAAADWFGRIPVDPKKFKAVAIPMLKAGVKKMEKAFAELDDAKLLHFYEVKGKRYAVFHEFQLHNRTKGNFKNPKPKSPPPPKVCDCIEFYKEEDPSIAKAIASYSLSYSSSSSNSSVSSPVREVFDYWIQVMELDPKRTKLDSKRRKLIEKALKAGYEVDGCKKAIDGCRTSPFHMGENDNGKVYNQLSLILRSADKIEQFIGYLQKGKGLRHVNGRPTNRLVTNDRVIRHDPKEEEKRSLRIAKKAGISVPEL